MLYRSKHPPVKVPVIGEISGKPNFHNYGNFENIHTEGYGEVALSSLHDNLKSFHFMRSNQIISEYKPT